MDSPRSCRCSGLVCRTRSGGWSSWRANVLLPIRSVRIRTLHRIMVRASGGCAHLRVCRSRRCAHSNFDHTCRAVAEGCRRLRGAALGKHICRSDGQSGTALRTNALSDIRGHACRTSCAPAHSCSTRSQDAGRDLVMNALPPPEDVAGADEAVELLRGWIVDGDLQVSLAFEAFGNNPEVWGRFLAETAVHVADAMASKGYGDRNAILAAIHSSLLDNMDTPRDGLHGSLHDPVQ